MGRKRMISLEEKFKIIETVDNSCNPPKKKKIGECKSCNWTQTWNATRMAEHCKTCDMEVESDNSDIDLDVQPINPSRSDNNENDAAMDSQVM